MVLACVALDREATAALQALGVTDSKRYGAGPKAHDLRAALVKEVQARARHIEIAVIEVPEIDARTRRGELNRLEQEVALQLLGRAPPATRIVADGERIFAPLGRDYPHLCAENKAELSCTAVAAASLCAKVRRDELWQQICVRYRPEFGELLSGFAGGGYLNEATRGFLRAYCARYRRIPPEGRASWPWDFVAELLAPEPVVARVPSLRQNLLLPGFE
jgi:ribonuclease HII